MVERWSWTALAVLVVLGTVPATTPVCVCEGGGGGVSESEHEKKNPAMKGSLKDVKCGGKKNEKAHAFFFFE